MGAPRCKSAAYEFSTSTQQITSCHGNSLHLFIGENLLQYLKKNTALKRQGRYQDASMDVAFISSSSRTDSLFDGTFLHKEERGKINLSKSLVCTSVWPQHVAGRQEDFEPEDKNCGSPDTRATRCCFIGIANALKRIATLALSRAFKSFTTSITWVLCMHQSKHAQIDVKTDFNFPLKMNIPFTVQW